MPGPKCDYPGCNRDAFNKDGTGRWVFSSKKEAVQFCPKKCSDKFKNLHTVH